MTPQCPLQISSLKLPQFSQKLSQFVPRDFSHFWWGGSWKIMWDSRWSLHPHQVSGFFFKGLSKIDSIAQDISRDREYACSKLPHNWYGSTPRHSPFDKSDPRSAPITWEQFRPSPNICPIAEQPVRPQSQLKWPITIGLELNGSACEESRSEQD